MLFLSSDFKAPYRVCVQPNIPCGVTADHSEMEPDWIKLRGGSNILRQILIISGQIRKRSCLKCPSLLRAMVSDRPSGYTSFPHAVQS